MKLPTSIIAGLAAAGIMLSGAAAFAQPVFPAYYPNGTNLFQPSPTFSFNITDASATITNVTVQLVGTPMGGTGGSPALQLLGPSSGLNVVGLPGSAVSASCPLKTNLTYAVTITATDGNGISRTTNVSFTTIVPAYIWEAEDWDYTNGLYIDNPQTNRYAGLTGVQGVDFNDNGTGQGANYRPSGPNGLGNENCNDTRRLLHLGLQDYDVGWNNGGYWGNYTRHYPVGTYFVFMRGASTSQQQRNANLTVAGGNGVLTGSGTLAFRVPLTGGNQIYGFGPLLDANSQAVTFTSDGSASTLRSTVNQGNFNANFYMLMPTNIADIPQGSITITNIYPDGIYQMEATNQFVFTISSAVGIDPNSVILQVTSTNLLGTVGSVKLVGTANGLTISGDPSTSLNGSMLLATNTVYKIYIQATDSNGVPTSTTVNFDTVNPNYYTWEGEDGNYHNGQYIDNPQTNAYYDYSVVGGTGAFDCTVNVDAFYNGGGGHADNRLGGLATEGASDQRRPQFQVVDPRTGVNYRDFDLGNSSGNSWANYTRTFPAGIYNIYLRGGNGGSANSDSYSIGVVTGDPTSLLQTNNIIGRFAAPATAGWQSYVWAPLKINGVAVQWTATGSPTTLRLTTDSGSFNASYMMLVPADTNVILAPFIGSFQPDGTTMFQVSSALSFVAHSQVGVNAGNIQLTLNGTAINGLITSGSSNLLNVSYPVQTNKYYTAVITITDSHGTSISTNVFDTFDINTTYTWEAEDYDYTDPGTLIAGQFIDNSPPLPSAPSVDIYQNLPATEGIDEKDDAHTGSGYRPVTGAGAGAFGLNIGGLEFETAGDVPRAQYTSGTVDYNIGFNDGGNWANYTRNYPAGTYNVYMRCASPNGNASEASFARVTGGWGTTNQTTTVLGNFAATRTGNYHIFNWAPVMANGGLYQLVLTNSTTNTFRITVTGGGYNNSFYALVLADPNIPTISGLYPNGAYKFQGSSTLSFTAASPAGISSSSGISVLLTGTNLLGQTFTTNITTANGLNVSGPSTNLNVSLNLPVSGTYSAVITVTALSGAQTISRPTFDNLNPTMTFEAEDWNYTDTNSGIAGLFFNNPQTNAYAGRASTAGIDYTNANVTQGSGTYRPFGMATEGASDNNPQRLQYLGGQQDYDVGFAVSGNWGNYTRTFPTGVYNIYLRGADGNASQTDAASMSLVTSAATNSNQTTLKLGTFSVPGTGAWQTYGNVPLIDSDGNHAEFVGGGEQTLRVTTDNGNFNANYYFLVPEDTTLTPLPPHLSASLSGPNIVVTFLSRTNITYKLQFKTNLTDPAWAPVSTNSGTATWMSITNGMNGGSGFYSLKP
jgi:hypothetical protein